jgi:hypothetical protein
MVHYADSERAADIAPPACPKCRSLRTEIAGRSSDGRAVTVRCKNCDDRSAVLVDRRAGDTDNMTDEVEAIRAVGRALAQLSDDASRVRVLRWAAERFQIDATVSVARSTASSVNTANLDATDPTLSMDGLHELFPAVSADDDRTLNAHSPMMASEPADELLAHVEEMPPVEGAPQPDSMLHSFVNDFQRLANDCQTLFAT